MREYRIEQQDHAGRWAIIDREASDTEAHRRMRILRKYAPSTKWRVRVTDPRIVKNDHIL